MIKHIVKIEVPETEEYNPAIFEVEVYALSDFFAVFGNTELVFQTATAKLLEDYEEEDPYRKVIIESSIPSKIGSQTMGMGHMVATNVTRKEE
jgi:hypothetical protein